VLLIEETVDDLIARLHGLEVTLDKWYNELVLLRRQEPELNPRVFQVREAQLLSFVEVYEDLVKRCKKRLAKLGWAEHGN